MKEDPSEIKEVVLCYPLGAMFLFGIPTTTELSLRALLISQLLKYLWKYRWAVHSSQLSDPLLRVNRRLAEHNDISFENLFNSVESKARKLPRYSRGVLRSGDRERGRAVMDYPPLIDHPAIIDR